MSSEQIFYYFEVGEAAEGKPSQFVGMHGKSVWGDDLSRVLKFRSAKDAMRYYLKMEGRFGAQRLNLRAHIP